MIVLRTSLSVYWGRAGDTSDSSQSSMPRLTIEVQNRFGRWQHVQTKHNEADAFRTAQNRARSTGKRHRLVDEGGRLLDLIDP